MEEVFKIFKSNKLTATEKLIMVLFIMDDIMRKESNKTIGNVFSISHVTVSNIIRTLSEKGYVSISYNINGIRRQITINDESLWQ